MGKTVTILLFSGPIARENPGKKWEKTGQDGTTQYHSVPLGKVLSSDQF